MSGPIHAGYDVVIAGARVAGAATAMLLARGGLRVLVVDPVPVGRDTLSTHALMRGGVLQLHRWGLMDHIRAGDTPPVTRTVFQYGSERVAVDIKPRDGMDALYAPRRTVLDPLLVGAARDAGAHVLTGWAVTDVRRGPGGGIQAVEIKTPGASPRTVAAGLLVGADGLNSRVARLVQAPVDHTAPHCTASIYGYWRGLDVDGFEWHYGPGKATGLIPTNDGETCVFASLPPALFHAGRREGLDALFMDTVRGLSPALARRLGRSSGRLRAFAGAPGRLRRAAGAGWALVGDAGYFKDPLTAHGITDALRDAELLARAVLSGEGAGLPSYQLHRDRLSLDLFRVTDRIASFDWSLEELGDLHVALSRAMRAEVEGMVDLFGAGDRLAAPAATA